MADPVVLLKKDHHEVAAMLKTLAASRPGARRRSTLDKLDAALSLHMRIEEADIYPLVAKLVDEEDAEEANIEHGLARDGVAKLPVPYRRQRARWCCRCHRCEPDVDV